MKKRTLFSLILVFIVVGCQEKIQSLSDDERNQVSQEVSKTINDYISHLNAGNVDSATAVYSSSSDFYWAENGEITYQSSEAATESLNQVLSGLEAFDLSFDNPKVTVLGTHSALYYGEFSQYLNFASGPEIRFNGAITMLMRKEKDGWKILAGHTSTKQNQESQYGE